MSQTYYEEKHFSTPLVEEVSRVDKFMLNMSDRKLPYITAFGRSRMRSGGAVHFFEQLGCSFNLITGGKGIFRAGGRDIPVGKGDLCVSTNMQPHDLLVPPGNYLTKSYAVVYYNLLLTQLDGECNVIRGQNELFASIFRKIENLLWRDDETGIDTFSQSALAYELIYHVITSFRLEKTAGENEFKTFLHRIRQNLSRDYSLEKMAGEYCCSKTTLIRLFKKYCGVPPLQFIRTRRLEYAAYLLSHPDTTIRSVMRSCGYKDQSFFTREFHKVYKTTPYNYKKKHVSAALFQLFNGNAAGVHSRAPGEDESAGDN